jgi:hypothetical protein
MDVNIRFPCGKYITVKIEKDDTIITLKEKLCLTNNLFTKDKFNIYLPGQEQPLYDECYLLSLPNTPFLQFIPDTLDVSKLTYDIYSCERHNVTPIPSYDSSTIEEVVQNNSASSSLRIYTSSNITPAANVLSSSPEKPCVPPVPKAALKSNKYNQSSCDIM